jgi:hypothetical protein
MNGGFMAKKPEEIYQLKIWLGEIEPRIWRKFEVPSNTRLDKLNEIIQGVMGWTNSHLHEFSADGVRYGAHYPDGNDYNDGMLDESKARLTDLVSRPKERFRYEYDFGDGWGHIVKLLEIREPQENVKYPVCLEGERACPPEDCGGPWRYPELLEILKDPDHEEHEELLEWVGDEFDPEAFDIEALIKLSFFE